MELRTIKNRMGQVLDDDPQAVQKLRNGYIDLTLDIADLIPAAESERANDPIINRVVRLKQERDAALRRTPAVQSVTIQQRVNELIAQHGSLRAAARVLMVDTGYLSRLASGEKDNPSDLLLSRMGLRRVVTYERKGPTP